MSLGKILELANVLQFDVETILNLIIKYRFNKQFARKQFLSWICYQNQPKQFAAIGQAVTLHPLTVPLLNFRQLKL